MRWRPVAALLVATIIVFSEIQAAPRDAPSSVATATVGPPVTATFFMMPRPQTLSIGYPVRRMAPAGHCPWTTTSGSSVSRRRTKSCVLLPTYTTRDPSGVMARLLPNVESAAFAAGVINNRETGGRHAMPDRARNHAAGATITPAANAAIAGGTNRFHSGLLAEIGATRSTESARGARSLSARISPRRCPTRDGGGL